MNDFTMDELYILSRAVINLSKIDDQDSTESKLYTKIQSMIDNYCEHEKIHCKCIGQWICDDCAL